MRVLITGATGFIGSHVTREFGRRGHEVHVSARPGSDRRRLADIESKPRSTGWAPKYDFARGLRQTFDGWRERSRVNG
jgi:nucleoside-diphosphate-sugar epimerase